jgi:parallel beta-helix repeat protein
MKGCRAVLAVGLWLVSTAGCATGRVLRVPAEYQSIQSAIDAAQAGDTVEVAPGTYYETIILKEWVTVRSEGTEEEHRNHTAARRTIVDAHGEQKPVVEGADGAVIDGFTLTGVGQVDHHQPGHPHGVQCRGTSPIILNNIIYNIGSTGIGSHVKEGRQAAPYIENNIIYSNYGLGVGNNHESSATIVNNVIYSNKELGIGSKNGSHALIQGNRVYNNGLSGIGAKDGAFPTIVGNECYNNGTSRVLFMGAGISMQNTYVPLVGGNRSHDNYMAGLGMRAGAKGVVVGNDFYKNGTIGVAIMDGAQAELKDNLIHDNPLGGLRMDSTARAQVENNKIYHNGMGGIIISSDTEASIKGNEIYDNLGAGIAPTKPGPKMLIEDNHIHHNNPRAVGPFKGQGAPMFLRPVQ